MEGTIGENGNEKPSVSFIRGVPTLDQFLDLFRNLTGREPTEQERATAAKRHAALELRVLGLKETERPGVDQLP
jgi:hypothetical protein